GLESLVEDDEAVLVPVQQLDPVGPFIREDEQLPRQGVELKLLPHHLGERVERFAEVRRGGRHPNPDGAGQAEHHGRCSSTTASSRRSVAASKAGPIRSTRPSARSSSSPHPSAFGVGGGSGWGTTSTGTKATV